LRWSNVMQWKSFLKASIALKTAVGQLPTFEFRPPPEGDQQWEAEACFLVADANVTFFVDRHGSFSLHSVMLADGIPRPPGSRLGLHLVIGVERPELERRYRAYLSRL
jgi:hypothetical protein